MSKPLSPEERRLRLERGRRALSSRSASEIQAALDGLPVDGEKAQLLRSDLLDRLSLITSIGSHGPASSGSLSSAARYDLGGLTYSLKLARLHSPKPFAFTVRSSHVEVRLNLDHPLAASLIAQVGTPLPPTVEAVFLAWVVLEVEAGGSRRADRIQAVGTDWCRVLAALLAEASDDNADVG